MAITLSDLRFLSRYARLAGRPSEGQRDKAYIGDALVNFIFRKGRWVRA